MERFLDDLENALLVIVVIFAFFMLLLRLGIPQQTSARNLKKYKKHRKVLGYDT